MVEMEEEERHAKHNANNVTMYTFIQSPVTTNKIRKIVNIPNERQIYSDSLAETIKGFKIWRFDQQLTILQIIIQKKMTLKAIPKVIKLWLLTLVTEIK